LTTGAANTNPTPEAMMIEELKALAEKATPGACLGFSAASLQALFSRRWLSPCIRIGRILKP
jgi:hypothetical protein